MRLFKPTYRVGSWSKVAAKGPRRTSRRWTVEFKDQHGRQRRQVAFTDKAASTELGNKIERIVVCVRTGKAMDPSLSEWADALPPALRKNLIRWGLLDARSASAAKPLSKHIEDFKQDLKARGNTAEYAETTAGRVDAIREAIGAGHLSELTPARVMEYLARRRITPEPTRAEPVAENVPKAARKRKLRVLSRATCNHYLTALKVFCRWMVREGRVGTSPVAYLRQLKGEADLKHERRALTLEELRRLLEATAKGPTRFGMSGPDRVMFYRMAAETGLRARELRSLTAESFDLNGRPPTVTVEAAYSKHRRRDVLPLRPELAVALRAYLTTKAPGAAVFALPHWLKPIKMFKPDLEAAKIAYRTGDDGPVADFHALRHTFITNLARGGVHPKTAQSLARHSSITLTMDHYTHTLVEDEATALEALPDLSAPEPERVRDTGTEGPQDRPAHLALYLARPEAERGAPVASGGTSERATGEETGAVKMGESPRGNAGFQSRREDSSWRGRRGSNPQPPDRQSGTLTN